MDRDAADAAAGAANEDANELGLQGIWQTTVMLDGLEGAFRALPLPNEILCPAGLPPRRVKALAQDSPGAMLYIRIHTYDDLPTPTYGLVLQNADNSVISCEEAGSLVDYKIFIRGIKGDSDVFMPPRNPESSDEFKYVCASTADLRNAMDAGYRLQATVCMCDMVSHSKVPVPGAPCTAPFQRMLDNGQFTDAAVRAAGREWAVHRVVLAAASPVFEAMLGNESMVEAQTAVIELRDVESAEAVDLLIKHCYGAELEVPLLTLPALYALAEQYLIRSDLAWRLLVTLATWQFTDAALAALISIAAQLCPSACKMNLFHQAGRSAFQVSRLPGFTSWPLECVIEVVQRNKTALRGLQAALAWVEHAAAGEEGGSAAGRSHHWPALLNAVRWDCASCHDLDTISSLQLNIPGLQGLMLAASLKLCRKLGDELAVCRSQAAELREAGRRAEAAREAAAAQERQRQLQRQVQRRQEEARLRREEQRAPEMIQRLADPELIQRFAAPEPGQRLAEQGRLLPVALRRVMAAWGEDVYPAKYLDCYVTSISCW